LSSIFYRLFSIVRERFSQNSQNRFIDICARNHNLFGLLVASVAQLAEELTLNQLVLGSSPSRGTTLMAVDQQLTQEAVPADTALTQKTPDSEREGGSCVEKGVKFPYHIKNRGRTLVTIYGKSTNYPLYRVAWTVGGKRQMKAFPTFKAAKAHGEGLKKDLAKGKATTLLTPGQAADAIAGLEILQRHFVATGKRFTIAESVAGFCDAVARLGEHPLGEAVERFLSTEAVVQRTLLDKAVKDFIEGRKHLGVPTKEGERPKRSPVYLYNTAMWLNEFAGSFPGNSVCDLTKEHLNGYIKKFSKLSAKSRNDRRAIVRQFLGWCVAKDYLAKNHRLFEAVDFRTEEADIVDIEFYQPQELQSLLSAADSDLVPVIALGGLGGLRREEIMRLDWADVWRVEGKIEIGARIAKGRKRRLVDICPSLASWLSTYRNSTGPVWGKSPDVLEEAFSALRDGCKVPARRNGLRHAFITFHMAKHTNENLTAAECGNSPQMIHEHYRGLATKKEAEKWFAVAPVEPSNVVPMLAEAKA
jgi:integrase